MANSTAVKTIEELKELFNSTDGEQLKTLPFQGWTEGDHPVTWGTTPFDVVTTESKTKFVKDEQGNDTEKPLTYKQMVAYLDDGETVENISLAQASKIVPNGSAELRIRAVEVSPIKYPDFFINKATIVPKKASE
jgi:hypothetical protein